MKDPAAAHVARNWPALTQIGVSGLRQTSGYIREEYLPELQGLRGRDVLHEMATNDATIGAVIFAITMVLRSVEWTIQPPEGETDESAEESVELLKGMLFSDMEHTWPEFIDAACTMFVYGFAVMEILFKKRRGTNVLQPWLHSDFDDGLWGIRAIANRGQRTVARWIYDEDENLVGFEQQTWNRANVTVPLHRCLHFRTTVAQASPEGVSIIRPAYRPWYFLKRLQEIEGIGTERDLVGYPVMRVPSDILAGNSPDAAAIRAQYETLVKGVKRDSLEGILMPSDRDENGNLFFDLNLISSGGNRQLGIGDAITRYQKDIARSVLADFIFLGADGGGSLALGRTKTQTFVLALSAFLNHIAAQVNEVLVPVIWRMNGLDLETRPRVVPDEIEEEDVAALAAYVKTLADVGYDIAADRALEDVLRDKVGLPAAPDAKDYDPFADYAPRDTGNAEPASVEDDTTPEPSDDVGRAGSAGDKDAAPIAKAVMWQALLRGFENE